MLSNKFVCLTKRKCIFDGLTPFDSTALTSFNMCLIRYLLDIFKIFCNFRFFNDCPRSSLTSPEKNLLDTGAENGWSAQQAESSVTQHAGSPSPGRRRAGHR